MGSTLMLARAELRNRWKAVVALTLLVGFLGAVVIASAAGARRTASALDRFRGWSRTGDLELAVGDVTAAQLREFRRAPGVAVVGELRNLALLIDGADNVAIAGAVDRVFSRGVDRARVIRGRNANPDAAHEIELGEALAAKLRLDTGDSMTVKSFTPGQIAALIETGTYPERGEGPNVRLHVVGIVRRPLDLGVRGAADGVFIPTPAFVREYRDQIGSFNGTILRVRTDRGVADVPRVAEAARRIFASPQFSAQGLSVDTEGARNAISTLTGALWIFAAVGALAGIVTVGIVLSRQIGESSVDQPALRALGLTRRRRAAAAALATVPIAIGGSVLALLGATILSARFPIGLARLAEPDPGVRVDWFVLGSGVVVLAALVLSIATLAALRMTARERLEVAAGGGRLRTSATARVAKNLGFSPSATAGLRLALEPGSGRTALPVRSALVGASVGVLGVVAVVTFAASFDRLLASPERYGRTWDAELYDDAAGVRTDNLCDPIATKLTQVRELDAIAAVCRVNIELDNHATPSWGFRPILGSIDPTTVVEGRAPLRVDEVALGTKTLDIVGKDIGDSVRAVLADRAATYRVVGRVALPSLGEPQPLADGAVFTGDGLARLAKHAVLGNASYFFIARFAPGTKLSADPKLAALIEERGSTDAPVPLEIDRLRQVERLPSILAFLLSVLAVVAVSHALVTAVRRRRRDLALLKTLGFDRRQVRATIAWQANTLAAVGLLFGIPLGIVVGRLSWGLVAKGLGVATDATVPALVVLALVPATLLVANIAAALPARSAARTRPAIVLRSE